LRISPLITAPPFPHISTSFLFGHSSMHVHSLNKYNCEFGMHQQFVRSEIQVVGESENFGLQKGNCCSWAGNPANHILWYYRLPQNKSGLLKFLALKKLGMPRNCFSVMIAKSHFKCQPNEPDQNYLRGFHTSI
jgi:hypothetical protein